MEPSGRLQASRDPATISKETPPEIQTRGVDQTLKRWKVLPTGFKYNRMEVISGINICIYILGGAGVMGGLPCISFLSTPDGDISNIGVKQYVF